MAAEAAAPAASEGAAGAAGPSGTGGSSGAAGGMMSRGAPGLPAPQRSKGVLLAIAILLLWLAGFCFFIALEGSTLLTEQSDTTGGGLARAIVSGLAARASAQEAAGGGQAGG